MQIKALTMAEEQATETVVKEAAGATKKEGAPPKESSAEASASATEEATTKEETPAAKKAPPQEPYSGAWTVAEKSYATALIEEFRDGNIPDLPDKTTMRGYLAEKLMCPTKRISKKYEGTGYNGRLPYCRGATALEPDEAKRRQDKLKELEEAFKKSRAAIVEAKEAAPAKKPASNKSPSSKPKKKKQPNLLTAAHAQQLLRSDHHHAGGMSMGGGGAAGGGGGRPNLAAAAAGIPGASNSYPAGMAAAAASLGTQDAMLEAMLHERLRMATLGAAAGIVPPLSADLLLARRAALFDPLSALPGVGAAAGLLGGAGLPLQGALSAGAQFGGVFPPGGMMRPGLAQALGMSSALGAGGAAGLQQAAAPGTNLTAAVLHNSLARSSLDASSAAAAAAPPTGNSAMEEGLVDVLRRKRELESLGGMDPPEAKKPKSG